MKNILNILREVEPYIDPKSERKIKIVEVECSCGKIFTTRKCSLLSGATKSCGCAYKTSKVTHGFSKEPLYKVWINIKQRCTNTKRKGCHNYINRGIDICRQWLDNCASFREWANKNGYKSGYEIDRIDNDGGYSPENCRVVTRSQNNRNKRTNKIIEYNGQKRCLTEWCEVLKLNYKKIEARFRYGWSAERAFEN